MVTQKQKPLILQNRGGMRIYIYKDGSVKKESAFTGKMFKTKFKTKRYAISYAKHEGYVQIVK